MLARELGLSPEAFDELMSEVITEVKRRRSADDLARFRTEDGIVGFVREVLHADPTDYQERILRALVKYRRVAVRGPHGLGKTAIASWVILWGMYCFDDDVKIPTTASAWRQLTKFLWPEVRKWSRRVSWRVRPRILDTSIKMDGKEAFALASNDPALIEGAHARTMIFVFDESKAIDDAIFDAAEGAFSGAGDDTDAEAYALAISTPGEPSGRFYDIHRKAPGLTDWHTIHVTLDQAIAAGRISRKWADQRRAQWGEESAVYQNRVEGNFAENTEDTLVPLSWVEAAQLRWHECSGKGEGEPTYGVDPAGSGTNKTAIARLVGRVVEKLDTYAQQDTMQTVGRITSRVSKETPVAVDVIGIGAGVADRLKELEFNVKRVNVAEAAVDERGKPFVDRTETFEFVNLRSYVWWLVRESLNPENPDAIALPPDDKDGLLTGDLTTPKFSYTSAGKIKVEGKDDLKKRLKRSTDCADAVALALFAQVLSRRKSSGFSMKIGRAIWDKKDRYSSWGESRTEYPSGWTGHKRR